LSPKLVLIPISFKFSSQYSVSDIILGCIPSITYLATLLSNNASHVDLARALAVALAVAARAVDLAVVLGVEVDDVDGAAAVVLDDLVRGVVGAATDDVGGAVALDADGVFADVFEPDEFEVAGS
jgi:hypothetical protein